MRITQEQAQAQLDELAPMVDRLFDVSEHFVATRGNFLPHGATLSEQGEVALADAASDQEIKNAKEVLPLLHAGLRDKAAVAEIRAVATCESVLIGDEGDPAIKVLAEHRDGLSMAFYLQWKPRPLQDPEFGEVQANIAPPEVGGWA